MQANTNVIPPFDMKVFQLSQISMEIQINCIDLSFLAYYYNHQDQASYQNILLLNGILNKLEGRAEEVVGIRGANSWVEIKDAFVQNFGDQRDDNCLNHLV